MFREINRSRVSCAECGVTVAVSSLKGHMERQHVSSLPQTREVKIGGGGGFTYVVSFPRVLKTVKFLVIGCLEVAYRVGRLRENFMY